MLLFPLYHKINIMNVENDSRKKVKGERKKERKAVSIFGSCLIMPAAVRHLELSQRKRLCKGFSSCAQLQSGINYFMCIWF